MVSERIREALRRVAGLVPDGDEDAHEPLIVAWGNIRVSEQDAREFLEVLAVFDEIERYADRYGDAGMILHNLFLLSGDVATTETHQFAAVPEEEGGQ